MTIFTRIWYALGKTIRTTNLAIIIGTTFFLLLGVLVFIHYGYEHHTKELESVVSESRISATKMRYFSELAEAAHTRTRLTSQILHTEDVFEQDRLNQKLEKFAGEFAEINQSLLEFPLSAEETIIRKEQNTIVPVILPAQRKAVELAMLGSNASRNEAKKILYDIVIPGQNRLVQLFHDLTVMQQEQIQKLENESKQSLAETKEQHSFVVKITLAVFSIIIIFVIIRTRSIQLELERSRESLETKVRERTSELILARDEAERSNQAKSDFLSSMSHELRTPLNAILGFAQLLEYDESLNADQKENIIEITRAGRHLLDLINEVLDLSKIESGYIDLSLEPVDLNELVEECFSLMRTVAEQQKVALNYSLPIKYIVRADRTRLKQVIINLLSNAIKYNHENGIAELVVTSDQDKNIRILVSDSGKGIAADKLEAVFQPFNRLDASMSNIEGTGIGLTITKNLVEMMGGRIGVESQPDAGSKFWIELTEEHFVTTGEEYNISTIDTTNTKNDQRVVLYIEDNPANLKLVSQILSKRKHVNLITAHEPELGIELALAHQPDLILMDINMPNMDGYGVLKILQTHAELNAIPVIAITANAMPKDIERGKGAGFSDYLTKPLDLSHFLAVVEYYLSE